MNNFKENYEFFLKVLKQITEKKQFLRQNRKPKLKDLELIAINLTSEYISIDSECQLFRVLPEVLKHKLLNQMANRFLSNPFKRPTTKAIILKGK